MSWELFVGLRYLRARRRGAFLSLISLISLAGVTIGVATLDIVLAVMTGLENDLRDKILGMNPHVVVMSYGGALPGDPSLVERVRWVVENEINPQLAQHRGHVAVQEVTSDGVVVLRFGGGCHGCGMADVTLKQGIEKTLLEKVPGVTAVRDATDHDTGDAPYIPRDAA